MSIELCQVNLSSIKKGNFPLNHDCILKVKYTADSPLRFQFFTCRSQDSGTLVLIFKSINLVASVDCVSVDLFSDIL